jgi:putative SOS response-associated peptidase YedK
MCGRFALAVSRRIVAEVMGVPDMPEVPPRPEIFPSQLIEAVFTARETGRRMAGLFRWGFVPAFLADAPKGRPMINARSETALELPSFRAAVRYRRCLVPAQGYFEWRSETTGRKSRFFLSLPGRPVLGLGGIYERAVTASGEVCDTVAILTRAAVGTPASVHPRMPLIIAPDAMATWLDPGISERAEVARLLALEPPRGLTASAGPGQPSQLVL